jgi:acyl-CoA reductase-like NAD-dependent aldehyde dehydrogenase
MKGLKLPTKYKTNGETRKLASISEKVVSYGLYIDGQWIDKENNEQIFDKYNHELIGKVAIPDKENIDAAVKAAKKRFTESTLTPHQRYKILLKAAQIIEERKEDLASLITKESGNTIKESLVEVNRVIGTFTICAEEAKRLTGEMVPMQAVPGAEQKFAYTLQVPVGVVCAITSFNGPLNVVAHKVAPAIAAGNTIVLKPAPTTPLSAIELAVILKEAGLPDGHLNIVFGDEETGNALLENQEIDFYTFTGSMQVGELIKRRTGLRRVALELGNNSGVIVCEDADIQRAAELCVTKACQKAGQVCISVQRVYVHEDVFEEFEKAAKKVAESIIVGNPNDPATDMGPLHTIKAAEKAEAWIREAVSEGAEIVTGGFREGTIFKPTILKNVRHEMRIICQEVFAPLMSIIPFREFDHALDEVNNTIYGLQAGVFTRDIQKAFKASKSLNMGGVIINNVSTFRSDVMPYGGIKNSGIGREGAKYSIQEMTETRVVVFDLE